MTRSSLASCANLIEEKSATSLPSFRVPGVYSIGFLSAQIWPENWPQFCPVSQIERSYLQTAQTARYTVGSKYGPRIVGPRFLKSIPIEVPRRALRCPFHPSLPRHVSPYAIAELGKCASTVASTRRFSLLPPIKPPRFSSSFSRKIPGCRPGWLGDSWVSSIRIP